MRQAPTLLGRKFAWIAGHVSGITGHPLTFVLSCFAVTTWAIASLIFHVGAGWQTVIGTSMTMGTFLMVFLVQNTQNRNSAAVQAKLDELIRALEPANNVFIGLEDRTIEDVHELRQEATDGLRLQDDLAATAGGEPDQHKPA